MQLPHPSLRLRVCSALALALAVGLVRPVPASEHGSGRSSTFAEASADKFDRPGRPARLPDRLSDREFWRLITDISEADGAFRSDNLVSNEVVFARVVPELVRAARTHGVYVGVGPEQNFTYIAAIRPRIAFILDIRRGNLQLQLLYKALFELSATRAEFVGRLFNRDGLERLAPDVSVRALFDAAIAAPMSSDATYAARLGELLERLLTTHAWPLGRDDLDGIASVYASMRRFGPTITWNSSTSGTTGGRAEYAELMTQTDALGQPVSYLATEAQFHAVKDLESRNLVVPIVGDFAGAKAIKAIGQYLRAHESVLTAFYVSNVESYLRQEDKWMSFCSNVASLPYDDASVFVRPMGVSMQPIGITVWAAVRPLRTPIGRVAAEVEGCAVPDAAAGRMK